MDVVYAGGIKIGEVAREKIRLLLIISFDANTIAGLDQRMQRVENACGIENASLCILCDALQPRLFTISARRPFACGALGSCDTHRSTTRRRLAGRPTRRR